MSGLSRIVSIFNEISSESSKNGKEEILKKYKDDKEFREALVFLLDDFIVTGISTKKINKKFKDGIQIKGFLKDFEAIMKHLKENNSGRDSTIRLLQDFMNNLESDEEKKFIKDFVTKNLKLGISEKTVNKVYGKGTIQSFGVMLAESFAKKEAKVNGKFFITLKLDGNRCLVIKEGNKVNFFTRKGKPILGLNEIEEEFLKLPDAVYDGEILLHDDQTMTTAELFRATQKAVRKDGDKTGLEFHIFDMITLSEFKNGKSKATYEQRRARIEMMTMHVDTNMRSFENLAFIKILPVLYEGEDKNMIAVLMKWAEEKGFEGLMINTADGLYQTKRTDALLKVKQFKTADLLVMSIEKALDGQFEGKMARVNVEYKGNLVGVGSGFTIEQREQFVKDPDLIVGQIIEVQFFEQTKDEKTNKPSLRFPVFKGIRDDKTVEDINYGE